MHLLSRYWALLLLLPLLQWRCDNRTELPGFELNYIQDFEIFAGLNTLETHVFEFTLPSNYTGYLAQSGYSESDIVAIVPKYIRLVNLGGNVTFDILQRARLNIAKTDGTQEFEAAYREPVPTNAGYALDLIPTLIDATEQVQSDRFTIRLKLNFLEIPQQAIDTRLELTFQAQVE